MRVYGDADGVLARAADLEIGYGEDVRKAIKIAFVMEGVPSQPGTWHTDDTAVGMCAICETPQLVNLYGRIGAHIRKIQSGTYNCPGTGMAQGAE